MKSPQFSDEEQLVAACRRGERGAQREFFERHNSAVFRALLALSGAPGEAEDLLQETFLRAYRAIGGFRGHSSVRTWLLRIATNAFYEARRRDQVRQRHLLRARRAARAPLLHIIEGPWDKPGRRRDFRDLALRALGRLPARDRTILTLHDIEGYRYAEIAEILDIAPGTVGSRLSRARRRMRDVIRELLELDPEETLTLEHLYSKGRLRRGAPAPYPHTDRRNRER
ncbi:MAG: RNA polymerase sigma factor [Acidobacteriota bacterium]